VILTGNIRLSLSGPPPGLQLWLGQYNNLGLAMRLAAGQRMASLTRPTNPLEDRECEARIFSGLHRLCDGRKLSRNT
jgi:hypothetical protein